MTDRYKPVGKLRTYSDTRFAPIFIPEGAIEPPNAYTIEQGHFRSVPGGSCIEQTLYERVGSERTEAIELFNFVCNERSLYQFRREACRHAITGMNDSRLNSVRRINTRLASDSYVTIAGSGAHIYDDRNWVSTASDILSAALMLLEHDIATANENAQAGLERVC